MSSSTLALDGNLDLNATSQLRASLLKRRGADLAVDASGVYHLGAQCAQVLVAAVSTWAAGGAFLTFPAASEAFTEGARLLGVHSILSRKGHQA